MAPKHSGDHLHLENIDFKNRQNQVWEDQAWEVPVVEETYNPDRTRLSLVFENKQAKKTSEEKQAKKTSEENKRRKTDENRQRIRDFLNQNGLSKTNDIALAIGLSIARTRAILKGMSDVEHEGTNTNRKYRLKENNEA